MSDEPQQNLQGIVVAPQDEQTARDLFEKAFSYRGDVTLTLKDGSTLEGYVFDRDDDAPMLSQCRVRLMPKDGTPRRSIPYDQIASLAFTGRDTAAGRSFETWIKNYNARKAAGEKNISLHPENLED